MRSVLPLATGLAALILAGACAPRDGVEGAQAGQGPEAGVTIASVDTIDPRAGQIVGGRDGHGMHGYALPQLESLGGKFELVEATHGSAYTEQNLLGSWSLVYFGYMECLEACPIALASMPGAVDALQAAGIPAKAVFIDINAPRLDDMSAGMGHAASPDGGHAGGHAAPAAGERTGPEIRRAALAAWRHGIDPDIAVLSGTRKQVLGAIRAFQTRVEPAMMKNDEPIHHINHTTMIYVMDPQGRVAGVLYHSDPVKLMVATVEELAQKAPAAPAPPQAPASHGANHG